MVQYYNVKKQFICGYPAFNEEEVAFLLEEITKAANATSKNYELFWWMMAQLIILLNWSKAADQDPKLKN